MDDAGPSEEVRALAERFGARYEPHARPLGLNVARNTGVERSTGELVVFVDDDVEVCAGWLDALLDAAKDHPEREVFTGPILPRLEGSPPHSCGREGPPITTLNLGPDDIPTRFAWGANMTIRRTALERIGPFDVSLEYGGDEQEWQERLGDDGLYVAAAALHHRRSPRDARLRSLCRAAYARGRASRRFDAWRKEVPSMARELHTLAGCLGHVVRYRCPAGLTLVAHSVGRIREAIHTRDASPAQKQPSDDFLSGESGTVGGLDGLRRAALDIADDALEIASGSTDALDIASRQRPARRSVLVLCVARPEHSALVRGIRVELERSRHRVELCLGAPGDRGKFENLNRLLDSHPAEDLRLAVRARRRHRASTRVPRSLSVSCRALRARSCAARSPPRFARCLAGDSPPGATAWCARRASWRSGP